MATLFVDKVDPQSGTSLEIGSSGDTITIPSGATITNSGTATGFGSDNTPAFLAYANSDQSGIGSNTYTKLTNYGAEVFDTDNTFSSSRFTPGVAGKYFIFGTAYLQHYGAQRSWVAIYKNGSIVGVCADMPDSSDSYPIQVTGIVDMPNTTDYIEIFVRQQGTGTTAYSSGVSVTFGGYKIIT
jgi:hypothetical protein